MSNPNSDLSGALNWYEAAQMKVEVHFSGYPQLVWIGLDLDLNPVTF